MDENIKQEFNEIIDLAIDTIYKNKQALIFVNTKNSAEKQAEDISKKIKEVSFDELSNEILNVLTKPTKQCKRLSNCVKKGIAFHHSGLNHKQRELIEDNFRDGTIKIICCTPTLAAGLDLPAYRSIIKDLKRFTSRGMQFIPVLEYLQMIGRAGRPKYDSIGEAICIAKDEQSFDEIYEKYICGTPENIYSKLASEPILRKYVLSIIASETVKDEKELINFFKRTFFAFQFGDIKKLELMILNVLNLLEEWGFIKYEHDNQDSTFNDSTSNTNPSLFSDASTIINNQIKPTILGKRINELYLDPYTAHKLIEGLNKIKDPTEFSYLHLISNTLEMRPLLNVTKKENEFIENLYHQKKEFIIEDDYIFNDFYTFLSSIKTAFFFEEWINEKDEEFILNHFKVRPGEINYKTDIANWLLYSCHEISKILMIKKHLSQLLKLKMRIKYGVKEELLPLIKIKNIGKARARKLYNNNIKNIKDINNCTIEKLKSVVGNKIGESLKKISNYN